MKPQKTGFAAILFAFATILIGWLIQNHFVDLVGMWKEAKSKVNPVEPQQTFSEPVKTSSDESAQ